MADATGWSSAGAGAGTGATAGDGSLGMGVTDELYQAYLQPSSSSMNGIVAPRAANVYPPQQLADHQQQLNPMGAQLIPAPVGMPMPAPRPVCPTQLQIVPQPQQQLPPPPPLYPVVVHPQEPIPLPEHYHQHQDYSAAAYGNTTGSSTSPSLDDYGAGWTMYDNALMPFDHQLQRPFVPSSINGVSNDANITVVNTNGGFHQNSSPNSTNIRTSSYVPPMMNQPYYGANQHQAPASSHNNNQQQLEIGDDLLAIFGATAPVVPASPFEVMPEGMADITMSQIFQELDNLDGNDALRASESVAMEGSVDNSTMPQIFQALDNLDGADALRASGSVTMEGSVDNDMQFVSALELEAAQNQLAQLVGDIDATESVAMEESVDNMQFVSALELEAAQNQLAQLVANIDAIDDIVLNCEDYRAVCRKDLSKSDCGNMGRIVLPKKPAEENLPYLVHKEGIILEMDDLEFPDVWKFKYRFWPNINSRMYVLENTGEFVKAHNLEAGDVLVIYQHRRTGRYVARGVKASQTSFDMTVVECQCKQEGNNNSQVCGFIVDPPNRRYSLSALLAQGPQENLEIIG